ncbi:hypothetical protein [Mycolicibacterium sediminis]|uniref:Uncharacterized protein n=1 Tax=Mycolicibacterium sediminis TaxID=1286180 RepID=A0A7I7QM17_9MYCO|nr:hypothetical protein [Mycolicibacterium sediminis]BBY27324.1 hypothetical protein MSEDJ_14200 [Mycolicibacterium sediminis]
MSLVVERGKTRCPSCVAFADYSFVECGPDTMEYEVRCGQCGEVYREVTSTELLPLLTDAEIYVYTPYSERVRAQPWLRVVATGRRTRLLALEAAAAARDALGDARDALGQLPKRLPQSPLRELEAGRGAAHAV